MNRTVPVARLLPKFLAATLIASILAGSVPPHTYSPAHPAPAASPAIAQAAETQPDEGDQGLAVAGGTASPEPAGSLRFSPAVDTDDNPASNPTAGAPVPVLRIGGVSAAAGQDVRYAIVALAAEVVPDAATQNPAGALVTFRLWDDAGRVDLIQQARADAWGAAAAQFFLDDEHLAGQPAAGLFHYAASAPGYADAPARSFAFDLASFSNDVQLGAARLTAQVEADGRLVVDVESDVPIDDSLLAVQLTAVRLFPTPAGVPDKELLPPLLARRLNDHQARAEIYLDAGDYLLSASAASGVVEARSEPRLVHVQRVAAPPIAAIEQFGDLSDDGESIAVQYRTPDGDLALLRRAIADLPPAPESSTSPMFQERTRVGPFQWRTQVYSTTVETIFDDGKKNVALDGFSYDPIARTYDIVIESRLAEPVDDKLTVQVYGPNQVVIYEETAPIWLDPAQPFHYQFSLPSDRGEPYGLHVVVHDPGVFDWIIEKISDGLTTVFSTLDAAVVNDRDGFSLTAGFGFSLKVVEIDVATAGISCAAGTCKSKTPTGLIFQPGDWVGLVTDGVRAFLRNQYRDILSTDDMDAIIKKLGEGISLGALTLSATASGRYTRTLIDPATCVNQQARDQAKDYIAELGRNLKDLGDLITFRGKSISESLQSKGKISFAVPGAWFLGFQITPVLAFKIKGDKSGDYAIYGELQVELGGKGTLKLKASAIYDIIESLLNAKTYVISLYNILDVARTGQKLLALVSAASSFSVGGGCGGPSSSGGGHGHNPPPPNGSPDDRRDAYQNQFLPDPRGIGGDIQSLQQQIAIAQDAGLTRAAAYFTLQLRRQELAAFELDNTRAISQTAELESLYDSAYIQISGLISGTILPDPGETITDAVRSAYVGYLDGIADTSYDQERRALLDSLDFAQRQYDLLRGQELELQYELRQMLAAGGVAVVDSGLVEAAIGAIGSLGVRAQPIEIVAGSGSSGLPTSRYVVPYQAPPVVIVPSGGLYRYAQSDEARAWLETYVATGGTLIVLAQFDSGDWQMLPGGQVRGLGYEQDILCKQASVSIVNSSPWIVGIGRDRPDIQIDGSFTQWPSDATIILMRTTGNQMPAMIEYPYGLGQVVATSAYPDFYMNGLQSTEDIIFARSLFGQAYLQGTGQTPVVSLAPNQTASIPVEVANTNALSATQVTLYQDYYAAALGDSWRWAVHQPDPFAGPGVLPLAPPLPSGASRTVTFNLTAPARAGIYRLGYFMGANTAAGFLWNRSGTTPGVYYQVLSTPVKTDLFRFQLATDQPAYDFGQTATVTASLFNDRAFARTFTLEPLSGLNAAPVQVVVAPHSTVTQDFIRVVDRTRQVRVAVTENGSAVSELVATVRLKLPTLGLSGEPEQMLAGVAASGSFTAAVSNAPVGTTTVDWEVRQGGTLLLATATPLVGTVGSSTAELSTPLPAAPPDTVFTVSAALPNTGRVMTATIPVLPPVQVRSIFLADEPVIDDANSDALVVSLQDPGYPGQYAVQALLVQGNTVLGSSPPAAGSSGSGLTYETLALPLPASLTLGITPTIVISASGQFVGASASYSDSYTTTLPLEAPQVSLSHGTRSAGQPLDIAVQSLPDTVRLPADGPFDVALIGVSTYGYYWLPVESATPAARGVVLHTRIPPNVYSGGMYDVQVTSWRLDGWTGHAALSVPPHQLSIDAPAAVDAGDMLTVTVQNSGGVTATVYGSLLAVDRRRLAVAEEPIYLDAPAEGSTAIGLAVPQQLRSGLYSVRLQGNDQAARRISLSRSVAVNGVTAELDSRTDQPAYLASDLIATTSIVTASAAPLAGASLRLRVLGTPPPAGNWDGWRARLADGGKSNYVNQIAAGPFVPTWNAAPQVSVAPLAFDEKVILPGGSCANPQVHALDSLDGSPIWQSPDLPNYPDALAANSNHVYVRSASYCPLAPNAAPDTGYNSLVALDAQTGALAWVTTLNSYDDLTASDAAVLIQDADSNGFLLLDPDTGITRTVLSDVNGALLVGDRVYVREAFTDNLAAYDAATGGPLWSVAAPSDSYLVAANDSYVLTFQEYDYSTYDLTNLLSLYDSSGSHLGDITLSTSPIAPAVVLSAEKLYYLYVDTGGSTRDPQDIVSTVYAADLLGLNETVFFTSQNEITAMVGTGDQLHLFDAYDRTLLSLDETGALIGQSDVSAIGASYVTALTVQQQGLLALDYGGYQVFALQASGPVYDGGGESTRAVDATSVLREDWLAVDGSGVIVLPYPLTNPDLGDNPLARGLLYLEAVLYGAEPAAVAQPANRQRLAGSVYPFTVDNATTSVELASDRPAYRRNVPGYAQDDALSAVALSGRVRNTGLSTDDITLQILRSDGATVLSQTFSAVGPNETRPFSAGDPAPPQGAVVYTGTTSLGDSAIAQIQVVPPALTAASVLTPTTLALGEGATLAVSLANPGAQPVVVTADLGAGPQDVTLAAGEAVTLTRALTPAVAGELSLPVVFTGDISRSDTPTATVQEETATASIVLSGTVRSTVVASGTRAPQLPALVQGADAALDFVLQNDQSFAFDVILDYALSGPETRTGSEFVTLPPGPTTLHIGLGALATGDYNVAVTVRHARLGTVIASAALSFSVVSPVYALNVDVSASEIDASGDITITVTASSTTASEQPWTGTLVLEEDGDSVRRETITLLPGDSDLVSETLSLRDRAGPQVVYAALIGPDGAAAAEQALVIDGPPRLAPAAQLTGLTASSGAPGGPVTLTATLDNDGPAGDALLTFVAFDQTYEVAGALPAYGSRAIPLTVASPAGLLAGSYPAEVRLGDQIAKAEIVVTGAQIDLTQALDALSYQPGSQATWTVELHGVSGAAATYDVIRRYRTQAYTDTVTLGAGQTVDLPWTFDVGPASNRAQVIVRPHVANDDDTTFALIIDSQWVPVVEDPYAWLESDQPRYTAGETVHLTMHLLQPTDAAYVLRPDEIQSTEGPLLWTNLAMTATWTITNPYTLGDFAIDYTLPTTLRTGRYHFIYGYDSEERTLPIDVFGVSLMTRDYTVAGPTPGAPLQPGDPLTLTANLELDAPAGPLLIVASDLAPDGTLNNLGPLASLTTALPAGVTPITLHGVLPTVTDSPQAAGQPGAHQILLEVYDAATLALLGGDSAFVDVGKVVISALSTDHDVYAPGQPGVGTLVAFGSDTANVHVETSGGAVLLDQNVTLSGFQAFTFAIPTASASDEVLIGTVTDSGGLTSSLQSAYKVAASFDTTPPQVKILTPANGAAVILDGSHLINVSGVFSEETAIDTVLINGDPALLTGNTWTATVPAGLGSNLIQATALDAAGNTSQPDLIDVIGEPDYGIDFTVAPTSTTVNGLVNYSAVVTASELLTATVLFPFSVRAVIPAAGSATIGTLDLDLPVAWEGIVLPGQPVTIQWQGQASEAISRTISTLVSGEQMLPRFSQDVPTNITTTPLAVALADFQAHGQANAILLAWETVSEIDNAGFNVYRSDAPDGERDLLAFVPSAAPGSSQGAVYQWTDSGVPPGVLFYYWLESIDFNGQTALYGPVSALALTPTAVRLGSFTAAAPPSGSGPATGVVAVLLAGAAAVRRRRDRRVGG